MFGTIVEGFLLGLATGSTCLATCTPIYIPYLLTEERKFLKSFLAVMEISAGRFISYLAFGAMAGFVGTQIAAVNRTLFTSIAYILLSAYLVLSVVRTHKKAKSCPIPKYARFTKSAFFLGILTGINFCPSFLIALSKALDLGGTFSGVQLFFGFFFGTSIFLLPLAFIGGLGKIKSMANAARIASLLVAVWFTFAGVKGLVHYFTPHQISESKRIVEAFVPKQEITIVASEENFEYFQKVKEAIDELHNGDVFLIKEAEFVEAKTKIVLIDKELTDEFEKILENVDYFSIQANYPIKKMLTFMNSYAFSTSSYLRWEFAE